MGISTTSVGIIPAGANEEVQFNNNGNFGSSNDFTWDGSALGIGITSPLRALDVSGVLRATRSDANYPTDIRSVDLSYESGTAKLSVVRNDATFDSFRISTSSDGGSTDTSRLFIDTNGNIGVGNVENAPYPLTINTSVAQNGLIHTDGSVEFGSYIDATGGWLGTKTNHDLKLFTSNGAANFIIQASTGNIGIGEANPLLSLHVNSGAGNQVATFESSDVDAYINIKDSVGNATIGTRSGDMTFYIDDIFTEAMRITNAGDVGIGTNSLAMFYTLNHLMKQPLLFLQQWL